MLPVDAIERAIAFCEEHLRHATGVADMAEAASYSLFHFCRIFSQVTRFTPYDYLMRRRLTEAARDLRSGRSKILDVALDYQFASAEAFSRAFRRVFLVQPNQFRSLRTTDPRRYLPPLSREHMVQVQRNRPHSPLLFEREEQYMAGRMTQVPPGCEERITALWKGFLNELEATHSAAEKGPLCGYREYVPGWEEHGYVFSALAVNVSEAGNLARIRMPGGKAVRFVHAGGRETLHFTLDVMYHAWLPRQGTGALPDWLIEEYEPSPLAPERIILTFPIDEQSNNQRGFSAC